MTRWVPVRPSDPRGARSRQRNFFADRIVRGGIASAASKPEAVFKAYTDPFPTPESRIGTDVFPRAIRNSTTWLESIEHRLARLRGKPVELVWALKDRAFGNEATIARWLGHFSHVSASNSS